jgi:NAD(P)-dependent dehydrogenase (short-subunit alcohol dehydrogenase family)
MQGKVCLVTGATSGIGFVSSREIAQEGATVVLVGRNAERSHKVVKLIREMTGNSQVDFLLADLSDQAQIHSLANEIKRRYRQVDVLLNNAGAFYIRRQLSVDGIEMTFALNHLNYFLLTMLLLDALTASDSARVVNVSSGAHWRYDMDFSDLENKKWYNGWRAYCQSKLANLLFTYELARKLEGENITVNALHPGFAATNIGKNNGFLARLVLPLLNRRMISQEEAAQTPIYLVTSPDVHQTSGKYFYKKRPVKSSPASHDPDSAQRLWDISVEMTGSTWPL